MGRLAQTLAIRKYATALIDPMLVKCSASKDPSAANGVVDTVKVGFGRSWVAFWHLQAASQWGAAQERGTNGAVVTKFRRRQHFEI